jgi:hypothetical protein
MVDPLSGRREGVTVGGAVGVPLYPSGIPSGIIDLLVVAVEVPCKLNAGVHAFGVAQM